MQIETVSILDTDSILWDQFSGAGTYTADGITLTKTGNQFSINTGYVGQSSITTTGSGELEGVVGVHPPNRSRFRSQIENCETVHWRAN